MKIATFSSFQQPSFFFPTPFEMSFQSTNMGLENFTGTPSQTASLC